MGTFYNVVIKGLYRAIPFPRIHDISELSAFTKCLSLSGISVEIHFLLNF